MGGVLIHDDEAVAGLRDDVGLVHLRAGGAERAIEQIRRRRHRRCGHRAVGAPTSNAACAASARPCTSGAAARKAAGVDRSEGRRAAPVPVERGSPRAPGLPAGTRSRLRRRCSPRRGGLRAQAPSFSACTINARTRPGIAEAHFGLGRMHVDVDLARVERHEQRHHGWRSRGR